MGRSQSEPQDIGPCRRHDQSNAVLAGIAPARACVTILTYIEEKRAGLYGHNKTQLRRFAAGSLFAGNVLVATVAWIIVRLVQS